jgi:hypothetical protein
MPAWVTALFKPLSDAYNKRQERKMARESAKAKLAQAKQDDSQELSLNKDEYEVVATQGLADTWKDEYITVSVMLIWNLIVVGGVVSAFGYPQILQGIVLAVQALVEVGVEVGFIMTATIMAGLGLSVWKRF